MTAAPESILIVGAGQAGGAAALRREGYAGRITLAGAGPHHPYERPQRSKAVLPGADVRSRDIEARLARTASGGTLAFDRCLIATGGHARLLPACRPMRPTCTTCAGWTMRVACATGCCRTPASSSLAAAFSASNSPASPAARAWRLPSAKQGPYCWAARRRRSSAPGCRPAANRPACACHAAPPSVRSRPARPVRDTLKAALG